MPLFTPDPTGGAGNLQAVYDADGTAAVHVDAPTNPLEVLDAANTADALLRFNRNLTGAEFTTLKAPDGTTSSGQGGTPLVLRAGDGKQQGSGVGKAGGLVELVAGAGAPATAANAAGDGGQIMRVGAAGGDAVTGTAGVGSSIVDAGGAGGAVSGSGATGGKGGTISLTAGRGGASSGSATASGDGGDFEIDAGLAGANGVGSVGAAGEMRIARAKAKAIKSGSGATPWTHDGSLSVTPEAPTFSATPTIDFSKYSAHVMPAMTANVAATIANAASGQSGAILVTQDATGTRTFALTAPGGFTIKKDDDLADLIAKTGNGSQTLYPYMVLGTAIFISRIKLG